MGGRSRYITNIRTAESVVVRDVYQEAVGRRTLLWLRTVLLSGLPPANDSLDQDPVLIDVMRQQSSTTCNSGYISVAGNIVAYTLERPSVDNQPLFSAIPTGTYSAHLRY